MNEATIEKMKPVLANSFSGDKLLRNLARSTSFCLGIVRPLISIELTLIYLTMCNDLIVATAQTLQFP